MSDSLIPHGLQHARILCHHQFRSLLKLMCIKIVMPSNQLIRHHPLHLLPQSFPASEYFQSISEHSSSSVLCIRWPKHWSFSCSISPFNEYSWLISFRIDWFDFLAVQVTLNSLLHHHRSKASVLQCSVFFMVQHYWTWLLEKTWLWLTEFCCQSNISAFQYAV